MPGCVRLSIIMSSNATDGVPVDESPARLVYDSVVLLSYTTVEGTAYGIMFTLCVICTHILIKTLDRSNRRRTGFFFAYIATVFTLGTVYTVCSSRAMQLAYVDHRKFPTGPASYVRLTSSANPIMLAIAAFILSHCVNDGLIVRYMIGGVYQLPLIYAFNTMISSGDFWSSTEALIIWPGLPLCHVSSSLASLVYICFHSNTRS